MTPTHKTSAILVLAGLVAAGTLLLSQRMPAAPAAPELVPEAPPRDASFLLLQARLQSTHILQGISETHMAVTVQAPHGDDARMRPPVNLSVVIDRSGSMSGEKLRHAKNAALQLIDQLKATDRVSIVSYGTDVNVVFPSARATSEVKNAAYRAVEAIQDDGGTNLSGGLLAGRNEIERSRESGAVERVVLISDGLANEGIIDREALAQLAAQTAQTGVSITTVGVGLDFDERTMTGIAVSGRGNYYFAESSALLSDLFARELSKLGATVATSVRLSVTPAPGVDVLEAYGYPMQREGRDFIIPVADLHADETRKVVLRLRVDASRMGDMEVADVGLRFHPVDSSAKNLQPRVVSTTAHTVVTREERLVRENLDRDAIRHIERARTAKVISEATLQYESGNAAAAQQMMQAQQKTVLDLATALGDDEFAAEMETTTEEVDREFAQAPAGSMKGKRARKSNRARAYKMFK